MTLAIDDDQIETERLILRRITLDDLVSRVEPFASERFGKGVDKEMVAAAVAIAQERAVTLVQIVDQMAFLFVAESSFEIERESWKVVQKTDRIGEVLDAVIAHVESCPWTIEALALQTVTDALGIKFRKVAPAVYAAVEGIHRGLPLFDSMFLLGRERTLARLRAARARLA